MIKAVIDTNVLVSALLSPNGYPATILDHILNGSIIMCYDSRIVSEYQEVLLRSKFGFDRKAVKQVINFIIDSGLSIVPAPIQEMFHDEDDRPFYEVAVSAEAYLVTGNTKHFPKSSMVFAPQEFLYRIDIDYK